VGKHRSARLTRALALAHPGTPLREGLQRILQGQMGALVVIGYDTAVQHICSGGFEIDAALTSERLSELAKMDGAIVLSDDASRLHRANVHLVPSASIPTIETGTRHRTAERVAKSTGAPVIAVSEEMSTITVYVDDTRRVLQDASRLAARVNRQLQILERFRARLEEVTSTLTASEMAGAVEVREVAMVLQRAEMVMRIADDMAESLAELGDEGGLLRVAVMEAVAGVADERRLAIEDYLDASPTWDVERALRRLAELSTDDLLDLRRVASVLGDGSWDGADPDGAIRARGLRILYGVHQLGPEAIDRIVAHYPDLQRVIQADAEELATVAGITQQQIEQLKDDLGTIADVGVSNPL
jgi:diadenylate cyclase